MTNLLCLERELARCLVVSAGLFGCYPFISLHWGWKAKLERTLALARRSYRELTQEGRDLGEFELVEGGLRIELQDERLVIPWKAVDRVAAFKRDLLAVDRICMLVHYEDWFVELSEEMVGWDWLIHEMPSHLGGMLTPDEWFFRVMSPAFEPCWTVLYERRR